MTNFSIFTKEPYYNTEAYKLICVYKSRNYFGISLKISKASCLIGRTITGIIITYYNGFLFVIIGNSAIWFAISTVINIYYWHYTGFKDEFYLASKYIINRKKNKMNYDYDRYREDYNKFQSTNLKSLSKSIDEDKTSNIGRPIIS